MHFIYDLPAQQDQEAVLWGPFADSEAAVAWAAENLNVGSWHDIGVTEPQPIIRTTIEGNL